MPGFDLGGGFDSPDRLPEHQRSLHQAQMAAERRRRAIEREARKPADRKPPATNDEAQLRADQARWPGLIDVEQYSNPTEEQ